MRMSWFGFGGARLRIPPPVTRRHHPAMVLPGEVYFGSGGGEIQVTLRSCVALAVWHPTRRIGGLCHVVLPERRDAGDGSLDGRYAEDALAILRRHMAAAGTHPREYQARLYGGGDLAPDSPLSPDRRVGGRNVEAVRSRCERQGFHLLEQAVGDSCQRKVTLDMDSGRVSVETSR